MESFINAALESALKIKNILDCKDSFLYECHDKGAGGDISIGADLKSEEILIKYLNDFGNIDSEESGFIDNKKEKTIICLLFQLLQLYHPLLLKQYHNIPLL